MTRRCASVLIVLAVIAGACAGGDEDETTIDTVEIFGPYRTEEAALLAASLDDFSEATGIEIRYTGTGAFVTDLEAQLAEAADPPDIAVVPQPGLVAELARNGRLAPLSDAVIESIAEHYNEQARQLGAVDGEQVGVPFRVSVKSLVWYRPATLDRLGLSPPTTLDELEQQVETIEAAGLAPWCLGIEAQAATGWVLTDWVEDLLLREAGVETYYGWIDGRVEFSDPSIAESFASFRSLVLDPGRLDGGVAGALRTSVQAGHVGMLADPPSCVYYHQSNVAWGWMPDGLTFGPDADVDFFVLPGRSADEDPPLLVGLDLAIAFDDRPAVQAVMAHLATPESTSLWAAEGGFTSPRRTDTGIELQPPDQAAVDLLLASDSLNVDASDAMPPELGTTPFWNQISRWASGAITYDQMAVIMDDFTAGVAPAN